MGGMRRPGIETAFIINFFKQPAVAQVVRKAVLGTEEEGETEGRVMERGEEEGQLGASHIFEL